MGSTSWDVDLPAQFLKVGKQRSQDLKPGLSLSKNPRSFFLPRIYFIFVYFAINYVLENKYT